MSGEGKKMAAAASVTFSHTSSFFRGYVVRSALRSTILGVRLFGASANFGGQFTPSKARNLGRRGVTVRCSGSPIKARPSSELRKSSAPSADGKLLALRELFSSPDVGIDAYIIPSQDAHQVSTH